ncbi:MAG: 16S rRNA (adenine(1518)-N(6)/adenine(1519)-N(6))-dimethyltransferase RsmA [Gammaproteobacteria bacterium]|nr:16S rRNA (adenine(1518)-N(6)/adenine(1519)-N(6))-dimethyltransferase RsmA [Gammaproteobacteria bacterium]QOJ32428.1 MAG: 16S rRNA (adenine(1518)-N(6)/adenine(1519)-N(6))-dimethyltransferase RsmA [Gammaproteobacteria bacterium]
MNHRPRKSLGQHFLHDRQVIGRILTAIDPRPGERFVEIGPGRGALTLPLLEVPVELDVVELDRELAAALARDLARPGFRVHHADALKFDYRQLGAPPRGLRLAANLPYNISTPLLFHLLDQQETFRDLHVMLQREVVERMTAQPGTAEYGRLTVALAARCRVEKLFIVRPGSFTPPPQVDSAVARLIPDAALAARIADPAAFDRVLARAFSMRRKRLANALKGLLDTAGITACGVDPGCRPGDVPPEAWIRLANRHGNP